MKHGKQKNDPQKSDGSVYKLVELVGSSSKSSDDAVNNAVTRAAKTLRNLRWFQVTETRGSLADGKVAHWQVTVKIGFTIDDDS